MAERKEAKIQRRRPTRGGDLWWDYRWRYFFITVSPLLFSLLLASFPTTTGWWRQWRLGRDPQRRNAFPSSPSAYISLTDATPVHTPLPPRPPRGGLYLNNIHELRYTRQIYCSDTRGFERPSLPSLQPSPPPPLLFSPSPRILLLRFEIETFSLLNEISFFFLLPSLRYFSPLFFSIAIDFSPFFVSLSSFFPYTSDFTNRRSLRLIIICVFVVI